ncbi:centrosomal protein of 78 kda [Echinococcus multilocularis]|uniref:Centrosomal protein of 78 kDa n=1 Tax=Echinococcus multilocularis TaxID=6211 RepID=A0A068YM84_ECHMU|nr:centrosomal protein of 78 kda [Echinococcus multilocularis]
MAVSPRSRPEKPPDFLKTYKFMCDQNDAGPLKRVMRHAQDRIVDINVDNIRFRRKELDAVLRTLEVFPKTQTIAFRSLLYKRPNKRKDPIKLPKKPSNLTQPEVLTDICRSLLISATANQSLRMLELQNLPLACDDIVLLCQGLVKARNLRFLSFENSQIGDGAVTELCSALKRTLHVIALNLSGCGISDIGIRPIVNLLQVHALQRQGEMWKDSLRYQTPNMDTMGGIRRLTLNDNPHIGNNGSKLLCEVLRDDRWVKAIDLQNCGLADPAGQAWLNLLKAPVKGLKGTGEMAGNRTLGIVDLRRNKKMDRNILRAVTEHVLTNSHGKHLEFKWLRALAKPANRGRVTDWPGMVGVLRLDLDAPQPPKRTSTANPTYQPKPIPAARTIQRPNFRPAGGPLTSRPLLQARAHSLPRLNSATQAPQPAPRLGTRQSRLSRSASVSAQNTPWKVGLTRVTSVYLGGDDESNYNNNLHDENAIVRGIPWRTAARARRNTETTTKTEALVKVPPSLMTTLNKMDLVNGKQSTNGTSLLSSSPSSLRKASLPSYSSVAGVEARKAFSIASLTSSANTFAKGTSHRSKEEGSPESRLRQQLKKHMRKRLENMDLHGKRTDVLRDLYARLNATLSEVEKVVKKLADQKKPKLTAKSEEEQLLLIRSALRGMMTPLRRQMSTDKVNQASFKVNQRRIFSYGHYQKKNAKSTRDVASGTSTRSTKHSTKKASGSQKDRRGYGNLRPKPRVANSAGRRAPLLTRKEDNPSSTTSLSEIFFAKPGRAISLQLQNSTSDSSPRGQAQSLPKSKGCALPVRTLRMARSAPSLVKSHSRVYSKAGQKCIDLFDDFGNSKMQEEGEATVKPPPPGMNMQCGDVLEGETLYSDY